MQQQKWVNLMTGRIAQANSLPRDDAPANVQPGKGIAAGKGAGYPERGPASCAPALGWPGSSGHRASQATAWAVGLAVLALTAPMPMPLQAQANAPAAAPANKSSVVDDTRITPLLVRPFNDIPGKEGMVLTVEYAPGASTEAHRHEAHTFVYVLEGAIVMQVQGGEAVTLKAGQTFYESPTDVHTVSRNASATEPAKFLVFFVKNKDKAAVLPVK